jgi:hypothetical protein
MSWVVEPPKQIPLRREFGFPEHEEEKGRFALNDIL